MVTIRQATAEDATTLSELLGEIDAYYGGKGEPGDVDRIRAALFDGPPAATVLLAHEGGELLGMASYSRHWPAGRGGQSLFLKELYVRTAARRRGVGRVLMDELVAIGTRTGCTRLEWTADDDNPPALDFYAALGVERRDGKLFYRRPL